MAQKIPVKKTSTTKQEQPAQDKNQEKTDQSSSETAQEPKRLYRSETNVVIAGVAAGLAEYLAIDPIVIRLLFILSLFFGGFGVLVYLVLWILLPTKKHQAIGTDAAIRENIEEIKMKAEEITHTVRANNASTRGRNVIAYIIIGIGVLFLLDNFNFIRFDLIWPFVLIGIGFLLLTKNN